MTIPETLHARAPEAARALSFLLLVAFAGSVEAGSFTVSPTLVQLRPDALTATVQITNTGQRPLIVEVAAFDWRQDAENDFLTEATASLIAVPPVVTIEPTGRQIVRVGLVGPPASEKESGWRLVLTEVPAQTSSQEGVSLALEFNIPVFFTPTESKHEFTWRLETPEGQDAENALRLALWNSGSRHVKVLGLELLEAAEGEPIAQSDRGGYLLPGTRRWWSLEPENPHRGATAWVRARTTAGTFTAEVAMP